MLLIFHSNSFLYNVHQHQSYLYFWTSVFSSSILNEHLRRYIFDHLIPFQTTNLILLNRETVTYFHFKNKSISCITLTKNSKIHHSYPNSLHFKLVNQTNFKLILNIELTTVWYYVQHKTETYLYPHVESVEY